MAFLPNLGGPAVSLLPLSIGYMQVAQLRFKRREQNPTSQWKECQDQIVEEQVG